MVRDNDGHSTEQKPKIKLNIGLDDQIHQAVVKILNITLADEAVLSMKTRGAHWNVSGAGFFELHSLYDSQYEQLNNMADEIAERARMLGGIAIGSLYEFINSTRLQEKPGEVPDLGDLLADHKTFIGFLREDAEKCSVEYEDKGTSDLLISVMRLHEKIAWMLRSYSRPELMTGEDHKRIV
jgi:starvation-inducible DNA-binding protein